jgi:hypothetical protein
MFLRFNGVKLLDFIEAYQNGKEPNYQPVIAPLNDTAVIHPFIPDMKLGERAARITANLSIFECSTPQIAMVVAEPFEELAARLDCMVIGFDGAPPATMVSSNFAEMPKEVRDALRAALDDTDKSGNGSLN